MVKYQTIALLLLVSSSAAFIPSSSLISKVSIGKGYFTERYADMITTETTLLESKNPKAKGSNNIKKFKSKKTRKNIKKKPLKELKLGSTIDGKVVELVPFGAFIQTDYQTKRNGWALLHKSQIQGAKIDNVSDVFKVGQKIKNLRVISIDQKKGEVSLSLRKKRAPRKSLSEVRVGQELTGKVKGLTSYGAFVDVGYRSDALVHISRISLDKIEQITDYLQVGDEVKVHIISIEKEKKTMAASMLPSSADEYLDRRAKYKTVAHQSLDSILDDFIM